MKFIIYKYNINTYNDVELSEQMKYIFMFKLLMHIIILQLLSLYQYNPIELLILFSNKILLFVFC